MFLLKYNALQARSSFYLSLKAFSIYVNFSGKQQRLGFASYYRKQQLQTLTLQQASH